MDDLPRLTVFYPHHHLSESCEWVGEMIEVDVLTVHFATGNMRVVSVEKIKQIEDGSAEYRSFSLTAKPFWDEFCLRRKQEVQCG